MQERVRDSYRKRDSMCKGGIKRERVCVGGCDRGGERKQYVLLEPIFEQNVNFLIRRKTWKKSFKIIIAQICCFAIIELLI